MKNKENKNFKEIDDYFNLSENEWFLIESCFKGDRAGNLRDSILSTILNEKKSCYKFKAILEKDNNIAIQLLEEDIPLVSKDSLLFYISRDFTNIQNNLNKSQIDLLFNFSIQHKDNIFHSLRERSYQILYCLYSYDIKKYRFLRKILENQIDVEYSIQKKDPYHYNPNNLINIYAIFGKINKLESYSYFRKYLEKYNFKKPSNRFIKQLVKKDGLNIYYSQKDLIRISKYHKSDWLKEKFYYFLIKEFYLKDKKFQKEILKTSFQKDLEFIIDHIISLKLENPEILNNWNSKDNTRERLIYLRKNNFKKYLSY